MIYLIRAQALSGYPELVRQLGGNPEAFLSRHGLPPNTLNEADAFLDQRTFMTLLEEAAEELDAPDFGLRLAGHQDLTMMGMVGLFLQQARNVRAFLEEGIRIIHLHNQFENWELSVEGELATIRRHERGAILFNPQGRELSIGVLMATLRQLIGANWTPKRVTFIHGPTAPLSSYRVHLRSNVFFLQEFDGVVFEASLLERELSQGNDKIREMLEKYLSELAAQHDENLSEQVKALMQQSLGHHGCTLERFAALMGLSPRTLQRRLAEHGDSFRSLLNEVKIEAACRFLSHSDIPLTQLSQQLGYTEASAFTRAFRQQTGQTPKAWRNKNRHMA